LIQKRAARKVNEKLSAGYELYGSPFLSEEMMYQAMTKPILQIPLPLFVKTERVLPLMNTLFE